MSDLFYYVKKTVYLYILYIKVEYQASNLCLINFKYKVLTPNSEPIKSFETVLTLKQMHIFEIKSKLSSAEVSRTPGPTHLPSRLQV